MAGRWYRSSRDGRVGPGRAVLADLGDLACGLLAVYQATGEVLRLEQAIAVIDHTIDHYADRRSSGTAVGFFDTADDSDTLILRPRDPTDGAAPSGLSAVTHALLTAAALTGRSDYRLLAESSLGSVAPLVQRFPRSAGWHLAAAEALVAGPLQIAVSGPAGEARDRLAAIARRRAPAGSVIDVGEPNEPGRELLAHRPTIAGDPAAYVCRGFVCDRPVTALGDLLSLLSSPSRMS